MPKRRDGRAGVAMTFHGLTQQLYIYTVLCHKPILSHVFCRNLHAARQHRDPSPPVAGIAARPQQPSRPGHRPCRAFPPVARRRMAAGQPDRIAAAAAGHRRNPPAAAGAAALARPAQHHPAPPAPAAVHPGLAGPRHSQPAVAVDRPGAGGRWPVGRRTNPQAGALRGPALLAFPSARNRPAQAAPGCPGRRHRLLRLPPCRGRPCGIARAAAPAVAPRRRSTPRGHPQAPWPRPRHEPAGAARAAARDGGRGFDARLFRVFPCACGSAST